MEIKDVCYLAIVNSQQKVLISYNYGEINESEFLATVNAGNGDNYLYNEQMVYVSRFNDISVVLLAMPESNEIFVAKAFEALNESLSAVIKNWCEQRVAEKYDVVMLIINEFVYRGIILSDLAEVLSSRILKRTFENTSAIKVNKGFASFLNKATKSFRK